MKRIALAFAFAVLATTSALAADNSVIVTPGTGVTLRSKDVGGGIESLMQILGDVSGNPLPTAPGTSNASFALPIQGVTGGIAVPISGLVTANPGTAANWGIGATGSGVPANAVYMGIISGGNLTGWTGAVTQGTAANLNATVVGTGTFAVQLSGATNNINNVSGTISLPTGAATSALQTTINTTLGSPFQAGGSIGNTTFAATQATAANLNATVVQGTATNLKSQVSIASAGVASGSFAAGALASGSIAAGAQVDLLTMRGAVGAGTAPADALIGGAVYNSTPLTVGNTQSAALQSDANGYLKVNIAAGGGSGGTSATYGAAFPSVGTPSGGTDGTNFQPLVVDTTTHYLQVDVKAGGAGGGAVYGPTAAGTAAANPPVLMGGTIDGTSIGNVDNWKIASGLGYVSAVLPSASVASGAFASGAFATGSMVDLLTMRGSASGGTAAADSILAGGIYNSSAPTLTNGQQASLQFTSAGSLHTTVDNSNANGATTASASSPVVQPTDQVSGKPISSLVKGTTASMTGTTSTQLIAAVSSKVIYVMNVDCVNSSATATLVTLQDGSGGTALGTVTAAASGGGHAVHATFPETWTTSGNGLYVADVTTGGAVICTASGFAQ